MRNRALFAVMMLLSWAACDDDDSGNDGAGDTGDIGDSGGGDAASDVGPETSDDAAEDPSADTPTDTTGEDSPPDDAATDASEEPGDTGADVAEVPHYINEGTPCFLSDDALLLLVETAVDLFNGTDWVISNTAPQEAAHALSLIGGDRGSIATAFMIVQCTEASTFDPYCVETFEDVTEFTCSQLGCEAAAIITTDAWFAEEDHTNEDDPHVFTYDTTLPVGTATYDPNPIITWRADVTGELFSASAEVDIALSVAVEGAETYDMSHAGTASGQWVDEEHYTIDVELTFPNLDGQGEDIGLTVALTEDLEVTGTLTRGDATIAEIGSTVIADEPVPVLTWSCPE